MDIKSFKRIEYQKGDALIGALLAVFIFSLFLFYVFIPEEEQRIDRVKDARVKRDIATILEAVISHRTDGTQTWIGTYPSDIATLKTRGYLPGFNNNNVDGSPYSLTFTGRNFAIVTTYATAITARRQGSQIGNGFDVTGNTLTVFGSPPGDELSHLPLYARDGSRPMTGTVNMDGNDMENADLIESDRITVNSIDGETAVFRDLRIIF